MSFETMTKLSTITADGTSSMVTFTSIPQTYTDLVLYISARSAGTSNGQGIFMQPNGDGGTTNYSVRAFRGAGTNTADGYYTVNQNAFTDMGIPNASHASNIFSNIMFKIPNYTSSDYKSCFAEVAKLDSSSTNTEIQFRAYLWRNTSPVQSLAIGTNITSPNFVSGSTFTLYGVESYRQAVKPEVGIRATGGRVTRSGGFTYHTFTSSGLFAPKVPGTAFEVLVVAGGGGGGGNAGLSGAGGAGGLLYSSSYTLDTPVTVIVGAGGANNGSNGTNSRIAALNAIGGGGGAVNRGAAGSNGGSGGGGGDAGGSGPGAGGTGTTGQGNNGGAGSGETPGGGGGAGGAGTAGNGGAGSSAYTAWATATNTGKSNQYAAGGSAEYYIPDSDGNSGNGGHGVYAGDSGVVIIRYQG